MNNDKKIAITTSGFAQFSQAPLDLLRANGVSWVMNPHGRALTREETRELLAGCTGVVAGTEAYDAAVMEALPELRCISRCGAGMDSVDLKAAASLGVALVNTPDAPTRAVAELTLGLALNLVRRISEMDAGMGAGNWQKLMGNLLQGMTVGIVGMGRIGRESASLFRALGCQVMFYDPYVDEVEGCAALGLGDLLKNSRLVCLHCPGGAGQVIGRPELALMPEGSWLINTARGGLVDEEALLEALESGRIAGAGLDVFAREPYTGPLAGHARVITTPHIGSYAREARIRMETAAVENLLQTLGWRHVS